MTNRRIFLVAMLLGFAGGFSWVSMAASAQGAASAQESYVSAD